MKILALDDEQGALKILTRCITAVQPDAELHTFMDANEALKFAYDNPVDVAFLDIQMPVLTGLEVAKRLKKHNPNVNVIFTTGFSEYALEAIKLRSSGYLMKPITKSDVKTELENLRIPHESSHEEKRIRMKTFGSFEIFVDKKVLSFRRERSKEMLAYLVDRRGSSVTRKELAAMIFEDKEYSRATQTYITQIISNLKKTLEEAGIGDLLVVDYNTYAVNTDLFTCDSYEYLDGNPEAINQFHGEYMTQYSWSKYQMYQFYE